MSPATVGEQNHETGADGTRRAKKWLDSTTRVKASYTNEKNDVVAKRLSFAWPHGGTTFSFDLGGLFMGDPYQDHAFMAESKKYQNDSDQGVHWDKFIAQAYVVVRNHAQSAQHFLWITWAPFRARTWHELLTPEKIKSSLVVEKNRERLFGKVDEKAARALIDDEIVSKISSMVWIIVLSDKQETLVISEDHRALVLAQMMKDGLT